MRLIPAVDVKDAERLRELNGRWWRVRGRVRDVRRSRTGAAMFIWFYGCKLAAGFKVVIFSDAQSKFARKGCRLVELSGKEVEVAGTVRDHPVYGLQIIIGDPAQIMVPPDRYEEDDWTEL